MHRTLLLTLGSLSIAFAGGQDFGQLGDQPVTIVEAASQVDAELLRVERFQLYPRGERAESDRAAVGTAKFVSWKRLGGELLEMGLVLDEIETHIQRTYRSEVGTGGTFVFREWRNREGRSQTGRSLVVESLPTRTFIGKPLLREWAGGAVRRDWPQIPTGSQSMLQVLERERAERCVIPAAMWQTIFDDLEGTWEPALLVRTPLALGLLRGVHLLDVFPSNGARHSRWLFQGEELLGFLEGDFQGSRDLPVLAGPVAILAPTQL